MGSERRTRRPRCGWIAALALAAGCGGAAGGRDGSPALVDPARLARVADGASVWRFEDAEGEARVERENDRWVRSDWGGYPVADGRLDELRAFLAALTVLSEAELEPHALAAVGLDGPHVDSCELELAGAGGALRLRLGHPVFDANVPARFARLDDDTPLVVALPRELSVGELAPHPAGARVLLDLGSDRVASFRLTASDGVVLSGRRDTPEAADFVPVGTVDPLSAPSRVFASIAGRAAVLLAFDRAAALTEVDRGGETAWYELETFDGLALALETFEAADSPARRAGLRRPRDLWLVLEGRALPHADEAARAELDALRERTAGRAFLVPGRELMLLRTARPSSEPATPR